MRLITVVLAGPDWVNVSNYSSRSKANEYLEAVGQECGFTLGDILENRAPGHLAEITETEIDGDAIGTNFDISVVTP
jgi:hypothetical protein